MTRLKQTANILSLISSLRDNGSWCGETHIQKSAYILECLGIEAFCQNFILYKYGPYSFGFHDALNRLIAESMLVVEIQPPYGPHLYPVSGKLEKLKSFFPKTLAATKDAIQFVTSWLGGKSVSEMEQLATSLYVWKNMVVDGNENNIAEKVIAIKPHVSLGDAVSAAIEVKKKMNERGWTP